MRIHQISFLSAMFSLSSLCFANTPLPTSSSHGNMVNQTTLSAQTQMGTIQRRLELQRQMVEERKRRELAEQQKQRQLQQQPQGQKQLQQRRLQRQQQLQQQQQLQRQRQLQQQRQNRLQRQQTVGIFCNQNTAFRRGALDARNRAGKRPEQFGKCSRRLQGTLFNAYNRGYNQFRVFLPVSGIPVQCTKQRAYNIGKRHAQQKRAPLANFAANCPSAFRWVLNRSYIRGYRSAQQTKISKNCTYNSTYDLSYEHGRKGWKKRTSYINNCPGYLRSSLSTAYADGYAQGRAVYRAAQKSKAAAEAEKNKFCNAQEAYKRGLKDGELDESWRGKYIERCPKSTHEEVQQAYNDGVKTSVNKLSPEEDINDEVITNQEPDTPSQSDDNSDEPTLLSKLCTTEIAYLMGLRDSQDKKSPQAGFIERCDQKQREMLQDSYLQGYKDGRK